MALKSIFVPALRAMMGDWIYYIGYMQMDDVAARVKPASEVHESKALSDLLQRVLDESKHARNIASYLKSDPQRFFNSLVVGVYGGSPTWHAVSVPRKIPNSDKILPDYVMDSYGVLEFSGDEKLFAIDGQHRAKGIELAIKDNPKLGGDEVPLIFVGHQKTTAGMERTRRLFTRLNKYAKTVSKSETITLDEDDICAIVTRNLVESHPFFRDKVSIANSSSLSRGNREAITTISTLYDVCDLLLRHFCTHDKWVDFKKSRPSKALIGRCTNVMVTYWKSLGDCFPEIKEALESDAADEVAAKFRHTKGGSLLFRPIGQLLVTRAISEMLSSYVELDAAITAISVISTDISDSPWNGVLWNSRQNRMLTAPENQKAALNWLLLHCSHHLDDFEGPEEVDVRAEVAGVMNIDIEALPW